MFKRCSSHCSGHITFVKIFSPRGNGNSCYSLDEDSRLRTVWHTKTTVQKWQDQNSGLATPKARAPTTSCSKHQARLLLPSLTDLSLKFSPDHIVFSLASPVLPIPPNPWSGAEFRGDIPPTHQHLTLRTNLLGFDLYPALPLSPHGVTMMLRQTTRVWPGHLPPHLPSFLP